jgi:hypothetical protein
MADVVQIVEEAIATIRKTEPGDAKMRLESFLSIFVSKLGSSDEINIDLWIVYVPSSS